jgi:hypothetical protein
MVAQTHMLFRMKNETLHFDWGKTRELDGNVRLHADRQGKLMVVVIDGDAIQDKYHVEPRGMVDAVLEDRGHIALAVLGRLQLGPPDTITEPGTDTFRHFRLVLTSDHL